MSQQHSSPGTAGGGGGGAPPSSSAASRASPTCTRCFIVEAAISLSLFPPTTVRNAAAAEEEEEEADSRCETKAKEIYTRDERGETREISVATARGDESCALPRLGASREGFQFQRSRRASGWGVATKQQMLDRSREARPREPSKRDQTGHREINSSTQEKRIARFNYIGCTGEPTNNYSFHQKFGN
uniref:Uncharacterized protein n=1 Tax=Oryza rufipogon TaxID=4529 RepID=A0A0E0N0T1_ORYRU